MKHYILDDFSLDINVKVSATRFWIFVDEFAHWAINGTGEQVNVAGNYTLQRKGYQFYNANGYLIAERV